MTLYGLIMRLWFYIYLLFVHILSVILSEKLSYQFIIINYLIFFIVLGAFQLFKQTVDIFRIEFEVVLYLLHPHLIHLIEIGLDYVSDFEINHCILFI